MRASLRSTVQDSTLAGSGARTSSLRVSNFLSSSLRSLGLRASKLTKSSLLKSSIFSATTPMFNCLVLGGGGREHALCDSLAHSPSCEKLYAFPGGQGIAEMTGTLCPGTIYSSESLSDLSSEGLRLDILSPSSIASFCRTHLIDLVIVGPEQPLVSGISDALISSGISVFAPRASAARIEGSKIWMKDILSRAGIRSASYRVADSVSSARKLVRRCSSFPVVIKADGLASGKGVVVAHNREEADLAVERAMVERCFGDSGDRLIFEDFLLGEELSYFSLCDGDADKGVRFLGVARDYKLALDGDKGLNTGGMGSFSKSPPFVAGSSLEEVLLRDEIVRPLLRQIEKRATSYCGVLFLGLLVSASGVNVLEVNARFGDPEAQTLLPLLEGDLAAAFLAAANGRLSDEESLRTGSQMSPRLFNFTEGLHSVSVVASSKGYPSSYAIGSAISDIDKFAISSETSLYHAGTELRSVDGVELFHSSGGRVFTINGRGSSFASARARAYEALTNINWRDGFYRRDIASDEDTRSFDACCDKVLRFM